MTKNTRRRINKLGEVEFDAFLRSCKNRMVNMTEGQKHQFLDEIKRKSKEILE